MLRERLAFGVCAAPFGRTFFFSCRSVEVPTLSPALALGCGASVLLASLPRVLTRASGSPPIREIALTTLVVVLGQVLWNTLDLRREHWDRMLAFRAVVGPILRALVSA